MQPTRKIIIAGGSGFLGRGLARHLAYNDTEIVALTRGPAHREGNTRFVTWDARTLGDWAIELDNAVAIVNLVGKSVDCRKTPANKAEILRSRVDSVTALAAALRLCKSLPPVWIQSATAHILGDTADEILDDASSIGTGFAPDVGTAWERAVHDHVPKNIRTVILRISFVLGRDGGALRTLANLARLGLGGTVGNGKQYISWIHEDDLHTLIARAIATPEITGTYLTTAPGPVTNKVFMRELRHAVHRPWSLPAPAPLVRFASIAMRTDPELALLGRRCVPSRLLKEGFTFHYPELQPALADLLTAKDLSTNEHE